MTVEQWSSTKTKVTISITGMYGDRRTSIFVPGVFLGKTDGEYYSFDDAKEFGCITSYSAENTANSDITVTMSDEYLQNGFRCVKFKVEEIFSSWVTEIVITTVLKFEYEKSKTKEDGNDIDITVNDMKEINLFGHYIDSWVTGNQGSYYSLDGVTTGDDIYAYYLWQPADNILNAASVALDKNWTTTAGYRMIYNHVSNILDNCKSNTEFYAEYFNEIKNAINNFSLKITKS